ncbi:hypothetical protein KI387_020991, partial [Taxus chinensis]
ISEVLAAEYIRSRLESTRCLIVLDDVWRTLSEEESWELFYAFAFSECEQNRTPRDLERIASEIDKESKRLPLAVKTVAASLAGKTSFRGWESKLRELVYGFKQCKYYLLADRLYKGINIIKASLFGFQPACVRNQRLELEIRRCVEISTANKAPRGCQERSGQGGNSLGGDSDSWK